MERVLEIFITVGIICHLLEAHEQNYVSVIGDNVEMKFNTNITSFDDAVLAFKSYSDHMEKLIAMNDAVVLNRYRIDETVAQSLSFSVESVHFVDAGYYAYTIKKTTIAVARLTVLDPMPNCTIGKQTNISLEYLFLECIFTFSGSFAPALKWSEDALVDIGVSSPVFCRPYDQRVSCKIPIRFSQALEDSWQSASTNVVAIHSEGCNQHKCTWKQERSMTLLGYTIRLDNSSVGCLGTLRCTVSPCRILKRTIRSNCEEHKLQLVGLIGAVTALSIIVVVLGGLFLSSCVKNQYLKHRLDFYIDMGHQKLLRSEAGLTEPASPPHDSESTAQVQLLSFRSTVEPGAYVEMPPSPPAHGLSDPPGTQPQSTTVVPIVLPPIPLPSVAASVRRSHLALPDIEPRQTTEHSTRHSEPPTSSTEYVKLTPRVPLQVSAYEALSQDRTSEQVVDRAREQVPDRASQQVVDRAREQVVDRVREQMVDRVREQVVDRVRKQVVDRASEQVVDRAREQVPDRANEQVASEDPDSDPTNYVNVPKKIRVRRKNHRYANVSHVV